MASEFTPAVGQIKKALGSSHAVKLCEESSAFRAAHAGLRFLTCASQVQSPKPLTVNFQIFYVMIPINCSGPDGLPGLLRHLPVAQGLCPGVIAVACFHAAAAGSSRTSIVPRFRPFCQISPPIPPVTDLGFGSGLGLHDDPKAAGLPRGLQQHLVPVGQRRPLAQFYGPGCLCHPLPAILLAVLGVPTSWPWCLNSPNGSVVQVKRVGIEPA